MKYIEDINYIVSSKSLSHTKACNSYKVDFTTDFNVMCFLEFSNYEDDIFIVETENTYYYQTLSILAAIFKVDLSTKDFDYYTANALQYLHFEELKEEDMTLDQIKLRRYFRNVCNELINEVKKEHAERIEKEFGDLQYIFHSELTKKQKKRIKYLEKKYKLFCDDDDYAS